MDVSSGEAAKRGGFGAERYENKEFQDKVRINYDLLMKDDPTWKSINTDGLDLDQVGTKLDLNNGNVPGFLVMNESGI